MIDGRLDGKMTWELDSPVLMQWWIGPEWMRGVLMAQGPMTPAEIKVGRRLPPIPKWIDVLMAGFVNNDGSFCGRVAPSEPWLQRAHLKARRFGWIRAGYLISFMGSRPKPIWFLTQAGKMEATEAVARLEERRRLRAEWSSDLSEALRREADTGRKNGDGMDGEVY